MLLIPLLNSNKIIVRRIRIGIQLEQDEVPSNCLDPKASYSLLTCRSFGGHSTWFVALTTAMSSSFHQSRVQKEIGWETSKDLRISSKTRKNGDWGRGERDSYGPWIRCWPWRGWPWWCPWAPRMPAASSGTSPSRPLPKKNPDPSANLAFLSLPRPRKRRRRKQRRRRGSRWWS